MKHKWAHSGEWLFLQVRPHPRKYSWLSPRNLARDFARITGFVLLLLLVPLHSHADISKCVDVPDITTEALSAAVTKVADDMVSEAGKQALLAIYRNARQNHQKFPFTDVNPLFTSRVESASLRNVAILQTLKHLTTIRDGFIAPVEALVHGDEAGTWAALKKFSGDQALSFGAALVLPATPAAAAVTAIKIYNKSVETLQNETCLLNIDLEYYALTMADSPMKSLTGKERVRYYTDNYLVGGGKAPDGLNRAVHRERAQCFLKQHLDPKLSSTVIDSGSYNPFARFVDAISGSGYADSKNPSTVAYRTSVQTMLGHFDRLAKMEKSRSHLAKVSQESGYRAIKSLAYAITPEMAKELGGLICDHLKEESAIKSQTAMTKEERCASYARNAVRQNKANLEDGCKYRGNKWTNDEQEHYNWCIHPYRRQAALDLEQSIRERELAKCKPKAGSVTKRPSGMMYAVQAGPYGGGNVCLTGKGAARIKNEGHRIRPLNEPCDNASD